MLDFIKVPLKSGEHAYVNVDTITAVVPSGQKPKERSLIHVTDPVVKYIYAELSAEQVYAKIVEIKFIRTERDK